MTKSGLEGQETLHLPQAMNKFYEEHLELSQGYTVLLIPIPLPAYSVSTYYHAHQIPLPDSPRELLAAETHYSNHPDDWITWEQRYLATQTPEARAAIFKANDAYWNHPHYWATDSATASDTPDPDLSSPTKTQSEIDYENEANSMDYRWFTNQGHWSD